MTAGPPPLGTRLSALLERQVIRRMGWSEPLFHGKQRDERGKLESYHIERPALALLRPRSHAFDALIVTPWARFGNAVVQISNAIECAERYGARRILLPPGHAIFSVPARLGRIRCVYGDAASIGPFRTALIGRFFHARAVGSRSKAWLRREHAARYMRDLIDPGVLAPDPRLGPDDVVAHLRAGDIFASAKPHPTYGQPPVAHYLAAIAASAARRVWLVYEDRGNPSIAALSERLRARGIEVLEQSATLAEDLRLLLSARRLVIGRSTLGDAVAALSRSLTDLYVFGRQRRILPRRTEVVQHRLIDISGEYIAAVQSANWRNTEAQRQLMLDYPEEALRIVREERGIAPDRITPQAGSGRTG
jgi:hypothetical protein